MLCIVKVLYLYTIKITEIMETYIENIIKTGLANGVTIEQMMSNPESAAIAYLESQLDAIEKAGAAITIADCL